MVAQKLQKSKKAGMFNSYCGWLSSGKLASIYSPSVSFPAGAGCARRSQWLYMWSGCSKSGQRRSQSKQINRQAYTGSGQMILNRPIMPLSCS